MSMKISELWGELQSELAVDTSPSEGWLMRLVHPDRSCPLFVAIEATSRRRAALLHLPSDIVPSRRRWPRCKGLEPLTLRIDGRSYFGILLKETRFADVFAALTEDLARRVAEAATPADQAQALLGQLSRWQKFLTISGDGLCEEAQRGLWGELQFLRDRLLPALGALAVAGWKGPELAHQDFQFEGGAIEVKTTLARRPQVVRITNERQLDDASWPLLLLHVTALDVREGGGESLPDLVQALRSVLAGDPAMRELLEEGLLGIGYLDAHADRYRDRGYLVRAETSLEIGKGFPRIVEADLPEGVGSVGYGLALSACSRFAIDENTVKRHLADLVGEQKRKSGRAHG
jgi:hypothetical protein